VTTLTIGTDTGTNTNRFAAVGLLPGAAGAMLLPDPAPDAAGDVGGLRTGDWGALPEAWRFLGDLARGDDVTWTDDGPVSRFNAAVLAGDPAAVLLAAANLGDAARVLAEATAYRLGADRPPPEDPGPAVDDRVRAYVMATLGHDAAEAGDAARGVTMLRDAAERLTTISPAACARLLGEAAGVSLALEAADARTLMDLERGAELLAPLGFDEVRGELLMARAELLMNLGADRPALLTQAVHCFQAATQALPRRTHAVPYAICHLNIAVAYLSMPMNEHAGRLRAAIAVQSLREALEIFTPEAHTELWQAATINLANALQHLPSSHVADNLAEAVALYRSVLELRSTDDLGRARLLGNLGNALAHLGHLDEAEEHLGMSRTLFERAGEADSVAGLDRVLAEIAEIRAKAGPGPMTAPAADAEANGGAP
jgi:tetratricopeptide (TPR) repeat protein